MPKSGIVVRLLPNPSDPGQIVPKACMPIETIQALYGSGLSFSSLRRLNLHLWFSGEEYQAFVDCSSIDDAFAIEETIREEGQITIPTVGGPVRRLAIAHVASSAIVCWGFTEAQLAGLRFTEEGAR